MNHETEYSHFRTNVVPCCVCGGEPHGTFCVKHGMKYVVCSACGHVYIRDQVGEDDLMAIYSNRKSHHHSSEKVAWDYSALKSEFYYDRLLKRIETYVETGRLLDLGCSNGSFVRAAMNRGWDAMGLELESDSVAMAKSMGVPVVRGVLHSQSFADGYFGAVTLWNLFEHLPDPNAVLREIYRILRPGGICAMCVPNIRSIGWYLLGAEWHAVEPQIHLNLFSVRTLSRLIRANGFKIRHIVSADIKPATLQAWTGKRLGRQPCPHAASVAGMARRSPARMKWMFRIRTLTKQKRQTTFRGTEKVLTDCLMKDAAFNLGLVLHVRFGYGALKTMTNGFKEKTKCKLVHFFCDFTRALNLLRAFWTGNLRFKRSWSVLQAAPFLKFSV